MNHLTSQQGHQNMATSRGKDTKPKMIVQRGLWEQGLIYKLNHKRLPLHPDMTLRKCRKYIFVNGCFCHGLLRGLKHNREFCLMCKILGMMMAAEG